MKQEVRLNDKIWLWQGEVDLATGSRELTSYIYHSFHGFRTLSKGVLIMVSGTKGLMKGLQFESGNRYMLIINYLQRPSFLPSFFSFFLPSFLSFFRAFHFPSFFVPSCLPFSFLHFFLSCFLPFVFLCFFSFVRSFFLSFSFFCLSPFLSSSPSFLSSFHFLSLVFLLSFVVFFFVHQLKIHASLLNPFLVGGWVQRHLCTACHH